MGRREKPLDPEAGPVQRLAHELRGLREAAGKPTYRDMARRANYSTSALSAAAGGEHLPSLPVVLAYVQALDAEPGVWEERWRAAKAAAEEQAVEETAETDGDAVPPYRGLARFEPYDRDLYFGRDALVGELLDLVRAHRFAAVFGPSGSGKSSLLRAGLVPALREATGTDRPEVIRVLTPGERPADTHEKALVPQEGEQEQTAAPNSGLDLGATHTPEPPVPTESASGDDTTDCEKAKCIALTFDDGPAAPETATLLKHLARYRARATFFTVGQNVAAHPELVRAEAGPATRSATTPGTTPTSPASPPPRSAPSWTAPARLSRPPPARRRPCSGRPTARSTPR